VSDPYGGERGATFEPPIFWFSKAVEVGVFDEGDFASSAKRFNFEF